MEHRSIATEVLCIICHQEAALSDMTAGSLYADGGQAFACIDHTWNRATWLVAWARFAISQSEQIDADRTQGRIEAV